MDALSYMKTGIVKLGACNAADLCQKKVVASREILVNERSIKGFAEKFFGWAIIWGSVESADAQGEGAVNYACRRQSVWIRIVLVVKSGGAADQRRKDGG